MTDLSKITDEELQKRIDEMPERIQGALASDELDAALSVIYEKYTFISDLDEGYKLNQLIVLLCVGFIHREELAEQIETYTYRSTEESEEIAGEILKIIGPVLPVPAFGSMQVKTPEIISRPISPSITMPPAPKPAPVVPPIIPRITASPAQVGSVAETKPNSTIAPDLAPLKEKFGSFRIAPEVSPAPIQNNEVSPATKETISPAAAPFMLHEQNEIGRKAGFAAEINRPTFIKPQFKAPPSPINQNQAAAKIDFGGGLSYAKTPQSPTITTGEPVKRVDYSSPATTAKPTAAAPSLKTDPNTIDLRDLPR